MLSSNKLFSFKKFDSDKSELDAMASGLEKLGLRVFGENGCIEERNIFDIQNILLNIYKKSSRSVSIKERNKNLDYLLCYIDGELRDDILYFLFLMIAHIRDCRKEGMGKGERDPVWQMVCWIWCNYSDKRKLIERFFRKLYTIYGSINDLNHLGVAMPRYLNIKDQVLLKDYIVNEWKYLFDNIDDYPLTAKWAPREQNKKKKEVRKKLNPISAKDIAYCIYYNVPKHTSKMKLYRKFIATKNRLLDTPQIHMCCDNSNPKCPKEGDWEINLKKVPGRFLHKFKASLERNHKNWDEYIKYLKLNSSGAKGTSVFITELVKRLSVRPDILAESQWNDQINSLKDAGEKNGNNIGDFFSSFICLLDFSGSMCGEPMNLAKAIGAFLTPLQNGPFRGKSITFETNPHWIDISNCKSIHDALNVYSNSPWGGTTNFYKAHELILQVLRNEKNKGKSVKEIKKMLPKFFLVVSDMQFDIASNNNWSTMHETLIKLYYDTGMELIREPLQLPCMIYWDARAETDGMPVSKSTDNAIFVNGTSTAILKSFLIHGVDVLRCLSPWNYLLETLMNPWYKKIECIF